MKTFKNVSFGKGRYRTQKAIAYYPSVATPNYKYSKEGKYEASVLVSAERAAQMKKEIAAEVKAGILELHSGAKAKPVLSMTPFKEMDDGSVRVTIAMKAKSFKGEDVRAPAVVDSKGRLLSGEAAVFGNGSTVDIGFQLKVWKSPALGYGYSFTPQVVVLYDKQLQPIATTMAGYGFDFDIDDDDGESSMSFDDKDDAPGREVADEEESDEAPPWDAAEDF